MTPWYDVTVGSWLAEFIYFNPSPNNGRIISRKDLDANLAPLFITPPGVRVGQYDNVNPIITTDMIMVGTIHKAISTWIQGRAKICSDGGSIAVSNLLTHGYPELFTSGISFMTPGPNFSTTGCLRHITYWPRELSDADMIEKTKVTA